MMFKRLLIFGSILILLSLLSIYFPFEQTKDYEKEPAILIRVIDGDTVETDVGIIRLLGIDTPERGEEGYQEAKDFLLQFENKSIELLRDFDDLGKYQRKLRYVFYEDRILNFEILEQGFARSFMFENLVYEDKLLDAEKYAIENKLGVWKLEG